MSASSMLDAFRIKPFDLDALYASWTSPPIFSGKPKDDPVAWLEEIKAGCKERKVPKDMWHRVGRHYMGPKPRERLDELGRVMQQMTGKENVWNWKKFKIAVQNIGWSSQSPKSKTVSPPVTERPMPKKQGSWWVIGKSDSDKDKEHNEKDKSSSSSSTEVVVAKTAPPLSITPNDAAALTTVTKAPAWLVNACSALEFLTVEHPKVMSAMSAVLITVGSLPAIPGVGVGLPILATGAAQAVGAAAVGIGQCLKAVSDKSQGQNGQVASN
ncbi:uncharacterized protein FOMMEDRAFT_18852 [Fomitiporia mediterranea MF3/22]|uniref:uncharacterized protein n=1 Tax=Fomitiporia mediterranea (strain MF3/22) TaxID=694068 RepID=UPI0004407327|nr:uncharacterized protein FOMMEDRAFT_18852 [Fomitiporia mediterranea MF3/22]EJD05245.1 hypothetical protein FOMMEDRAFT_18852 [Fomitiporia mediterranea MF3/22]